MLPFREEFQLGEAGTRADARLDQTPRWQAETFVLQAADRAGLRRRATSLAEFLHHHSDVELKDLAFTLNVEAGQDATCLAIVAATAGDLQARLTKAAERLAEEARTQINDAAGTYYFEKPLYHEGTLGLLFPGEGAQYLNMLADLRPHFPEIEQSLNDAELLAQRASPETGHAFRSVFRLPSDADDAQRADAEKSLRQLDTAMFSVLLADSALLQLLSRLGLQPAAVAGHSMGELSALQAAGCINQSETVLADTSAVLNALLSREATGELRSAVLLAVGTGKNTVEQIVRERIDAGNIFVAMDNCPHQTVVVGSPDAMSVLDAELQKRQLVCERLPFDRPYHTPLFDPYLGPLRDLFDRIEFHAPQIPIYSCSTGIPFPAEPEAIRSLAVQHYATPVEFTQLIKNMHADGVRVFVECGPRGNLTAFTHDILRGERFAAIASDVPHRPGIVQLNHLVAQLAAHAVPVKFEHFYSRRQPRNVEWDHARRSGQPARTELAAAVSEGTGGAPAVASTVVRRTHPDIPPPANDPGVSDRSEVVLKYFAVMEQFLDDQSDLLNTYLAKRQRIEASDHSLASTPAPLPNLERLPMMRNAEIVRFDPGRELVLHRKLDLREDLFASHHTIGGQAVSKVDPDQHGLPVMPMTFTLEMMAEAASALASSGTVVCLKNIRLFRWLAFDDIEPSSVEISVRRMDEPAPEPGAAFQIQVFVRELATRNGDPAPRGPAAQGVVVLAEHRAEPPPLGPFLLTNEHPCSIPREVMYKNLFHGPLFQGAQAGGRTGNEGIEGEVVVLPRAGLLASDPDPDFLMDPVLLDVSMHPVTAWHLEFPDQSGRILLPVELERFELFGGRPDVGERFVSRGSTLATSYRNFVHAVDLIDQNGKLWSRMHRLAFWRFYVPFANVNFHGPKDEYFISKEWCNGAHPSSTARCMRLDVPPDQKQAGMRIVTAKVVLDPSEFEQFRSLDGDEHREGEWLFGRLAAKDAVRVLWHARHGERLFPADIIVEMEQDLRASARWRGGTAREPFPRIAIARSGDVVVALAAFATDAGIALGDLRTDQPRFERDGLQDSERNLLNNFGSDRDEWLARLWCAKRAVGMALNCEASDALGPVREADAVSGTVRIEPGAQLIAQSPEWRSRVLVAHTARDGDLVVATSVYERASA
jgi:malonyl CoA-acyl carrier protein transacylase